MQRRLQPTLSKMYSWVCKITQHRQRFASSVFQYDLNPRFPPTYCSATWPTSLRDHADVEFRFAALPPPRPCPTAPTAVARVLQWRRRLAAVGPRSAARSRAIKSHCQAAKEVKPPLGIEPRTFSLQD